MNIGVLDFRRREFSFSHFDAGVNFRRQHVADEWIAQRNQVHIRSEEKSRKVLEWNQVRSVNGHAARAKLTVRRDPPSRPWHLTRTEDQASIGESIPSTLR